jgi:hypothetical protein
MGWGLLALTPLVLLLLMWWSWRGIRLRQAHINHKMATHGVTYLLLPRPDAPPTRAERVALWQRLSQVLPRGEHLSFELSGGQAGVMFSLRATDEKVCRAFLTKVMTEYPGAEARQVETPEQDPLWVEEGQAAVWIELVPTKRDHPLSIATPDPQIAVLGELALLPQGVNAGVQVLVRADFHTRGRLLKQAAKATSKKPETGPYAVRPSSEEKREVQAVDARTGQGFVEAQLLVWAAAPIEGMAWHAAHVLTDTLRGQYDVQNPLKRDKEGEGSRYGRQMPAFGGRGWSVSELGTLAHLVGGDTAGLAPQLLRARGRPLPPSPHSYIPRHARIADFIREAEARQRGAGSGHNGGLVVVEEGWDDAPGAVVEVEGWDVDVGLVVIEEGWDDAPAEQDMVQPDMPESTRP